MTDIESREREFHDTWAASAKVEEIDVTAAFEAETALENRFILKKLGNVAGRRLLDIGAGLGEASVYFACHGADVTALDVSPGMLTLACKLAQANGVSIRCVASSAQRMNLPSDEFDVVYAANVLHHVKEREGLFADICRVLKPGGLFVAWDPLAYNPVINVYRRMAADVRSADESPLTFTTLTLARKYFANVGHKEFWIAGLALFLKYYFIDGVDPNTERYWKRILSEERLWWWRPLRSLDRVLTRIPLVRRMAWNIVLWGEKPRARGR